jgi:hypothetical protein
MNTSKIDPATDISKIERTSETTWVITLEEDPETGDLIMPLPDELLAAQGWKIGDELTWDMKDSGEISLIKQSTKT